MADGDVRRGLDRKRGGRRDGLNLSAPTFVEVAVVRRWQEDGDRSADCGRRGCSVVGFESEMEVDGSGLAEFCGFVERF